MTADINLQDEEYQDVAHSEIEASEEGLYEPYRSVSKAAVIALLLTIFSLTGVIFPALLGGAPLAVLMGFLALRNIRRYPEELSGKTSAVLSIAGGIVLLAGGIALHTYVYLTEVPDGYERISFADLQPKEARQMPRGLPDLPVELDGKRIFVKGYVHPGVSDMGEIKKFILVPDMGTCCFGGQPSLTDMIEVTITAEHGLRYSQRKRKLAGTFHVSQRVKPVVGGLTGGYYALEADYAR